MIRAISPKAKTSARLWPAVALSAGLLALTACATPVGGVVTPEPTDSVTATATPESSPTATAIEDTPTPLPTETPTSDLPYNGQVLVVTAEREGDRLEVTAMIPNVAEDGGTCTLSLEGQPETATVTGIAGNGVTYCGVMSITPSSGDAQWQFRVAYTSNSTRAQSAVSTIESDQ